ncbi:glycosyltransferase family 4 protein [soil metagenome]
MRVIVVNRYATVAGGADKHAVGVAEILRSRGHAVAFLSTQSEANAEREGAFVPLSGADFWRGAPPRREQVEVAAAALWNRRAAAAAEALIERFRPDVVHLHDIYPQLSVAPVVVAARRGIATVQTLHNYELISASPTDHRGRWLDRGPEPAPVRALRTALGVVRRVVHVPRISRFVAVSRHMAETFAAHGIRADVMPNFVERGADDARPGFAERAGIAFVGRLTEEKGARDAIALARALPDVAVTMIGHGPLEGEAIAAARKLENLECTGFLSEDAVARRLRSSRVLAVPSRWEEPAGLVALEAMAEGTPVVAYASGGLAEYVSDAGAGFVVPRSEEALAAACQALYHDREAWAEASAAGGRAAARDHSPDRYGERLERLYAQAGASTRATGDRRYSA